MEKLTFKYKAWDSRASDNYVKKEYVLDVIAINFQTNEITIPFNFASSRVESLDWNRLIVE